MTLHNLLSKSLKEVGLRTSNLQIGYALHD